MSAAKHLKSAPLLAKAPETKPEKDDTGIVLPDGSMVVTPDMLARLGHGDVKQGRRTLRLMLADEREPKLIKGPTEKPPSVRMAVEEDEAAVLELLVLWWNEHAKEIAPIAVDQMLEDIQTGTRQRLGFVGVVDGPDGVPVACIVMVPARWSFSRQWFIREVYTFVHPEHRRSRHAEDLVQFAKWCADEWTRQFGYRIYLVVSVLTHDRIAPKIRFFRRFITQMGAGFMYPFPA